MTRAAAIKQYYSWLHCGNRASIAACTMTGSYLWPYRSGRIQHPDPTIAREPDPRTGCDFRTDKPLTRRRAIHEHCKACGENSRARNCKDSDCPLFSFRVARETPRKATVSDSTPALAGNGPARATNPQNTLF